MKLQVLKRFAAIALAGVMSFSVAFSGNLTVSAEEMQNGIVTDGEEGEGQTPGNGNEGEEGEGQTPGNGEEGEEGEGQTPGNETREKKEKRKTRHRLLRYRMDGI